MNLIPRAGRQRAFNIRQTVGGVVVDDEVDCQVLRGSSLRILIRLPVSYPGGGFTKSLDLREDRVGGGPDERLAVSVA